MAWFRKKRGLQTSPIMIAELLHQIMAEEDDPQAAPEFFHLPEAIHARFREKVFLYREANVLLALLKRVQRDLYSNSRFRNMSASFSRNRPKHPRAPRGCRL